MIIFTRKQLLNLTLYMGHTKKKWNGIFSLYVYGIRHNFVIFNIDYILYSFNRSLLFLNKLLEKRVKIFIYTSFINKGVNGMARFLFSGKIKVGYYDGPYIGGMLSNIFRVVNKKKRYASEFYFGHLRFFKKYLPGLALVVDSNVFFNLFAESSLLGIPSIGFIDSDLDFRDCLYPICSNNEVLFLSFYLCLIFYFFVKINKIKLRQRKFFRKLKFFCFLNKLTIIMLFFRNYKSLNFLNLLFFRKEHLNLNLSYNVFKRKYKFNFFRLKKLETIFEKVNNYYYQKDSLTGKAILKNAPLMQKKKIEVYKYYTIENFLNNYYYFYFIFYRKLFLKFYKNYGRFFARKNFYKHLILFIYSSHLKMRRKMRRYRNIIRKLFDLKIIIDNSKFQGNLNISKFMAKGFQLKSFRLYLINLKRVIMKTLLFKKFFNLINKRLLKIYKFEYDYRYIFLYFQKLYYNKKHRYISNLVYKKFFRYIFKYIYKYSFGYAKGKDLFKRNNLFVWRFMPQPRFSISWLFILKTNLQKFLFNYNLYRNFSLYFLLSDMFNFRRTEKLKHRVNFERNIDFTLYDFNKRGKRFVVNKLNKILFSRLDMEKNNFIYLNKNKLANKSDEILLIRNQLFRFEEKLNIFNRILYKNRKLYCWFDFRKRKHLKYKFRRIKKKRFYKSFSFQYFVYRKYIWYKKNKHLLKNNKLRSVYRMLVYLYKLGEEYGYDDED